MSLFAEYLPDRPADHVRPPPGHLEIRPATTGDIDAIAGIAAERNGTEIDRERARYAERLARSNDGDIHILVAARAGEILGYASGWIHRPPDDGPANAAPAGWYLTGVAVSPPHRRRGIGARLTAARLERIGPGTRVLYLANARNRATIDLHARFGFRELTRDFEFPGLTFEGGEGVLFERVTG